MASLYISAVIIFCASIFFSIVQKNILAKLLVSITVGVLIGFGFAEDNGETKYYYLLRGEWVEIGSTQDVSQSMKTKKELAWKNEDILLAAVPSTIITFLLLSIFSWYMLWDKKKPIRTQKGKYLKEFLDLNSHLELSPAEIFSMGKERFLSLDDPITEDDINNFLTSMNSQSK
jgi:hypothetical protein